MTRFVALLLLSALSCSAHAIVIRHDVDDAQYRIAADAFPALVDMPHEGHGVLIAPQWVLTAAHTLPMHAALEQVEVAGRPRDVERVIIHPGYKTLPKELIDPAMVSGEAMLIVAFLATSDDIALIKLSAPLTDVAPVALRAQPVQAGDIVQLVGKGATGNGMTGYPLDGPRRTALRRAYNEITSAYERWFCYRFDAPPAALPLEGTLGNGDSGGPVLIESDGQWQLAGLASWKVVEGNVLTAPYGLYGQVTCNVRLSHYADWIDAVIAGRTPH